MSRRFSFAGLILVVLVWSAILIFAPLRNIFFSQLKSLRAPIFSNDKYYVDDTDASSDDPRVLALRAESAPRKQTLKTYDQLIARFPREKWLLANRLRLSLTGGVMMDQGEFYKEKYPQNSWLTDDEMKQALNMVELGARRDPENSFYDWGRAIFLFGMKRNEAALRALHDGAQKSHFDDGTLRDMNNRIAVWQMQKSPLWEDRLMIAFSEVLPHFAIMRNAARAAVWQGELAERRGEHERALNIDADLLVLARSIRRDGPFIVSLSLCDAITRMAWNGLKRGDLFDYDESAIKYYSEERAERFAAYARRHGRADLADDTIDDLRSLRQDYDLQQMAKKDFYLLPSGRDAREIFRWKWIGSLCLRAIFWCGLLWLAATVWHYVKKWMSSASNENYAFETNSAATMLFGSIAFLTAIYVVNRSLSLEVLTDWVMSGNPDASVYGAEAVNRMAMVQFFDKFLPLVPLLIALIFGAATAVWQARKLRRTKGVSPRIATVLSSLASLALIAAIGFLAKWQFAFLKERSMNVWEIMDWLGLPTPSLISLLILLFVASMLYLVFRFGRSWLHSLRLLIGHRHSQSLIIPALSGLLITLSCVYLLTSIWVLPLRREANARMDQYLQRGEVAMMRESLKR